MYLLFGKKDTLNKAVYYFVLSIAKQDIT